MIINGKNYDFAYTVGAYLAINDLNLPNKTQADKIKTTIHSAVIMSKEFENRMKLDDSDYVEDPLTFDIVRTLEPYRLEELVMEVDAAVAAGTTLTVETESKKK